MSDGRTSYTVFERTVADYVAAHRLLHREARVVVALSGGADSVALLAVLTALGYDCVAAHCNFHLRGDESQRDMRHAQSVAAELNVDLCIKNFDVAARMAKTGESVEMACRSLRYAWFADLVDSLHAQAIAVGHHIEDQAETLMLNALRGSGIAGLAGMMPRNGHVVRPLLGVTRSDIEDYLRQRRLAFVNDSTNADSEFKRNFLRNKVFPLLGERFANPAGALARTAGMVADDLSFYNYAVTDLARRFSDGDTVQVGAMRRSLPAGVGRTLLFAILKPLGFNHTVARNIYDADPATSAVFASATGVTVAELSHGVLRLGGRTPQAAVPDAFSVSLQADIAEPVGIRIANCHISQFAPVRDARVAFFDAAILEGDPVFQLRRWRRGDRMRPFGMTGTKLLSDIMAGARLTPAQKESLWLLTRNGVIVWAVGLRASAHYAVVPGTQRFLRLQLTEPVQ